MIASIDTTIQDALTNLHSPVINWLWIFFAQYGIYIILLLGAYVFVKRMQVKEKISYILQTFLVLILARGLVAETITFSYDKKRPFETGLDALYTHGIGGSFPSGHTVAMFGMALVLYGFHKKAGTYALVIAALSAISRVIAGVHWISDMAGGFLIAWVVYVLLKKFVFKKFERREVIEDIQITQ